METNERGDNNRKGEESSGPRILLPRGGEGGGRILPATSRAGVGAEIKSDTTTTYGKESETEKRKKKESLMARKPEATKIYKRSPVLRLRPRPDRSRTKRVQPRNSSHRGSGKPCQRGTEKPEKKQDTNALAQHLRGVSTSRVH